MDFSEERLEQIMAKATEKALKKILPELAALLEERLLSRDTPLFMPAIGLKKQAFQETLEYIREHMPSAMVFTRREEIINYALEKAPADGLYLECGVASGRTINMLAGLRPNKIIYGFDSFEGLPEDWSGTKATKRAFSTGGRLPQVKDNVRLIKGLFQDTLPEFAAKHPGENLAFLHCYASLYSSTRCILINFKEMIGPGTVILFENFFNYPNWREHEFKAFEEFFSAGKIGFRFIALATTQAALIIESINGGNSEIP